jgi:hypothetical protein
MGCQCRRRRRRWSSAVVRRISDRRRRAQARRAHTRLPIARPALLVVALHFVEIRATSSRLGAKRAIAIDTNTSRSTIDASRRQLQRTSCTARNRRDSLYFFGLLDLLLFIDVFDREQPTTKHDSTVQLIVIVVIVVGVAAFTLVVHTHVAALSKSALIDRFVATHCQRKEVRDRLGRACRFDQTIDARRVVKTVASAASTNNAGRAHGSRDWSSTELRASNGRHKSRRRRVGKTIVVGATRIGNA